jgi:hypothetical protein
MWALIYYGIHLKPRYQNTLHPFNVAALVVNAFFVLLHIGQTKFFYDGLAQDVSVWTSFGSVVVMFIMVLIMENKRRGIFLSKGVEVLVPVGETLKRYHGYYFCWAVIYTFWFHPIELTLGHLAGTFYTIMLMLQGSLFFTSFHTNRWWTAFLEVFVAIHGAMVAYMMLGTGRGAHPTLFLVAGLGGLTLIQMWGVPLTARQRQIIGLTFIVATIVYYIFLPDPPEKLPIVMLLRYVGIALIALVLWLLFKTFALVNGASRNQLN